MINLTENFSFSPRAKKTFIGMMIVGLLGMILAFAIEPGNQHSRFWSNLLLNTYYFNGIALCGTFFVAATTVAYAGWSTGIRRVAEAIGRFVTVTFGFMFVILIALWTDQTNLYHHWIHPAEGDHIVAGKSGFLNLPFFTIRLFVFFGLWLVFGWLIRKASREEDTNPGMKNYNKQKALSAAFLVIFGVTTSMMSWDFNMSLDPHWYSTLYGWYNFGSYICAFWAFFIIISIYLKSRGYLKVVNENHIHDLGKLMFAFTVFYTYTLYDQYMLQWYSNVPEDTIWHIKRMKEPLFMFTFFGSLIINFLFPVVLLMSRGAKRNFGFVTFMSLVIIFGHYIDFFHQIMPEPNIVESGAHHASVDTKNTADYKLFASNEGAAASAEAAASHEAPATDAKHDAKAEVATHGEKDAHANNDAHATTDAHAAADHGGHHQAAKTTYASLGLPEIMIFIGFIGAFLFTVFSGLTKASLIPVNHPYLKESIKHHI